jgi:hypothetical protein
LANAKAIGGPDVVPFPEKQFSPQVAQLRQQAALGRDSDLMCGSWKRGQILEWLVANPIVHDEEPNRALFPPPPVPPPTLPTPVVKFRWNKNLEARVVCVIYDDVQAFLQKDGALSRQQIDAKVHLAPYWNDAAAKFNSTLFLPLNEYNHIEDLASLSPTKCHVVSITGKDYQITRAESNFDISGGGIGYGEHGGNDAGDSGDAGAAITDGPEVTLSSLQLLSGAKTRASSRLLW